MADYPTLYYGTDGQPAAGYGEMWTTEDLSKVQGVILYQQWLETIKPGHSCYYEHTSSHDIEMHQGTVDLYLCKDGKTISHSDQYQGDKDIYATFRNRDPRMYHTIMPPYKVKDGKGDYSTWSYTSDPADREYIDIMGANESCSNPGIGMKRLPGQTCKGAHNTQLKERNMDRMPMWLPVRDIMYGRTGIIGRKTIIMPR